MAAIQWRRATQYGIAIDSDRGAFAAGRMVDVLTSASGALIAAAETGGVWLITNGGTIALSEDWANPDVQCLAFGPDGEHHVLAGCTSRLSGDGVNLLMESNRLAAAPLVAPWQVVSLPPEITVVNDIAVVGGDRVVIACNKGVYWSLVPSPGGTYSWASALGLPAAPFFSVCAGWAKTVVAGAQSANPSAFTAPIYSGEWEDSWGREAMPTELQMDDAVVPENARFSIIQTDVDSCRDDFFRTVYALGLDRGGTPAAVLRSEDGGRSWEVRAGNLLEVPPETAGAGPTNVTNAKLTGSNASGGFIHRISVSPVKKNVVCFGLLHAYRSGDGGDTFFRIGAWSGVAELHDDVHIVRFDEHDKIGQTIAIASDGGVTSSPDLGATFTARNEQLATLQMYAPDAIGKTFYGRFDIGTEYPGLVVAGLQDNANVYTRLADGTDPWHPLDSGDGGACFLFAQLGCVHTHQGDTRVFQETYDEPSGTFLNKVALERVSAAGANIPGPFTLLAMERVIAPAFRNPQSRLMVAIGWAGGSQLYGLFADPVSATTGSWQLIASWPSPAGESVTAAATFDGRTIVAVVCGAAGLKTLRIQPEVAEPEPGSFGSIGTVTPGGPIPAEIIASDLSKQFVGFMRCVGPSTYYALYRGIEGDGRLGALLGTIDSGMSWSWLGQGRTIDKVPFPVQVGALPDVLMFSVLSVGHTEPPTLLVCTDRRVYASTDGGQVWQVASSGLPAYAHCSHLEAVPAAGGGSDVYLGTYGWGLWQTHLA